MADEIFPGMSFDLLAPHYRWMEFVLAGGKLQRCRMAFLDEISSPRNILLLGEGNGRSLVNYRGRFPNARITCMDASEEMLEEARRRMRHNGLDDTRVEFIHDDVLNWTPAVKGYDLIVTNFFLDCFRADQLELIISRIAAATTPGTNWLIADFNLPSTGLRRVRSRLILWSMYLFFRTVTHLPAKSLTAPDLILERAGFGLRRRNESEWGLLRSDWWVQMEMQNDE
jgi:ubiquinone/menaquinone biosynthesis C-methylase UbiE